MNKTLIKYCRLTAKLTQKELAKKIGVSQTLISNVEAGEAPVTHEIETKLMLTFLDAGIDTDIIYHVNSIIRKYTDVGEFNKL